jgi:hypothetical protein
MTLHRLVLTIGIAACFLGGTANAQLRTFTAPTHGGYPIGYCGHDPMSCGEKVATAFCRAQDYEFASEWSALPGLDATRSLRLPAGASRNHSGCRASARQGSQP